MISAIIEMVNSFDLNLFCRACIFGQIKTGPDILARGLERLELVNEDIHRAGVPARGEVEIVTGDDEAMKHLPKMFVAFPLLRR